MISTVRNDGVATITLQNPQRANALSLSLIQQFTTSLVQLQHDPTIYAVVVTGSGRYFCSGMDLSAASTSPLDAFEQAKIFFELVYRFPKPVIARMNGPALGGGVGLLFACDVRVCDKAAFIQLSEVKLGLVPALISKYIVPEVGKARAAEWMLCGERVPIGELLARGVVHAVVEAEGLDAAVEVYTRALATSAPGAMRDIKGLIRAMDGVPSGVDARIQDVFQGMFGEEAMYGMAQFRQKKRADWRVFYTSKL